MLDTHILKKIEKYKVISFDLFDTLIKRNVPTPENIFDIVQIKYNLKNDEKIIGFKKKRIEAYYKANRIDKSKCTIDSIYECLEIPLHQKEQLKTIELETEKLFCTVNIEMLDLYRYVIEKKRTIIISDMYLPHSFIEEIIAKCGIYGYEKLFVSCEYGVSKMDGDLFDIVLNTMKIGRKEILHIGDGWKNDYIRPLIRGIDALHIKSRNLVDYSDSRDLSIEDQFNYMIQQSIISNNLLLFEDEREKLGFEVFGPLVFGFVKWLYNELAAKEIKKVFFLAREGKLIKDVFEYIYPQSQLEIHYLYVSRKSLVLPTYWIASDYEEVMSSLARPVRIPIKSQLNMWGLDYEECKCDLQKLNISEEMSFKGNSWREDKVLKELYNLFQKRIEKRSKNEYEVLKDYLSQENFGGKCAIVDIGWNGGMQKAFEKIASKWDDKTTIYGYYFGIDTNKLNTELKYTNGYVYDEKHNSDYKYYITSFVGPLELTMSAIHGTTLGYEMKEGNVVVPVLEDKNTNGDGAVDYISKCQQGIRKYIEITSKLGLFNDISCEVAFRNCLSFGTKPKTKHINIFRFMGDNNFGEDRHFVNPKYHHLIGKNNIISGFWCSTWKSGYMKDLFRISFPYYKIYTLMRKIR